MGRLFGETSRTQEGRAEKRDVEDPCLIFPLCSKL